MPRDEAAGCGTVFAYGVAGAVIIGFPSFLAGFHRPHHFYTASKPRPSAAASLLLGLLGFLWDLSPAFYFRSATGEDDRAFASLRRGKQRVSAQLKA
jgi:hypothetical protein